MNKVVNLLEKIEEHLIEIKTVNTDQRKLYMETQKKTT